jgi:hypothetical protein
MAKKIGLDGILKGINEASKKVNEVKRAANTVKKTSSNLKQPASFSSNQQSTARLDSTAKLDNAQVIPGDQQASSSWVCECGTVNATRFCGGCGKSASVDMVCSKCQWKRPPESSNLKFCGNCGNQLEAGTGIVSTGKNPKQKAAGLRVLAVLMWVLAITAGAAAILIINGTIYTGENILIWLIAALAVDLVFVITGSQLWKKANRFDPASNKNKVKFWLWNNMGVIVSIIAFLPIIILILSDKKLDPKIKKIASIAGIIMMLIAGTTSYDWNPVSLEDSLSEAAAQVESIGIETTVYWTRFGKKYHLDTNCSSLSRSASLFSGTMGEAISAKRPELCSFCAHSHNIVPTGF